MEMDQTLYDKCAKDHLDRTAARKIEREAALTKWQEIILAAGKLGTPLPPQINLLKLP
jgi:hypothetical protein